MAQFRTDTCFTCFFYDYHRSGEPVGVVFFNLATPSQIIAPNTAPTMLNAAVCLTTTGTLPPPFVENTIYYAMPVDQNTFSLSTSPGGMAVEIDGPGTGEHFCDFVVAGCHRQAPQSSNTEQTGNPLRATWQPVDADYWCGEFLLTYPPGSGVWAPYTSVPGATGGGTYTTITVAASSSVQGKVVAVEVDISVAVLGSATGDLTFTLPTVPAVNTTFQGWDSNNHYSVVGFAQAGSNVVTGKVYNGTSILAGGSVPHVTFSGTYESQ